MDDPPFFGDRKIDLAPVLALLGPVFRAEKPSGIRAIVVYRFAGQVTAAQSDLLGGFALRKVVSDSVDSPEGRVELVERDVQGVSRSTVLTAPPVDLWLPMVETAGPSVLSFLLEAPGTAAAGVEAGVDFACGEKRQLGFREYFNPGMHPEHRGWHKRALLLPRNVQPGCWVILRALLPRSSEVAGSRVSWAQVTVQPLPEP